MLNVRFRHVFEGEIVETDVVTCTRTEWDESPKSKEKAWSVVNLRRGRIQAVQLLLPASAVKPRPVSG